MKTPFTEDDYFQGSTMSFGDHLDELRTVLLRAIYGLAIFMLVGMYFAEPVVSFFKGPIEKALEEYYRNKAMKELNDRFGADTPVEMLNLIKDREMVPEYMQIETTELLQNLQAAYPGSFDTLQFTPYTFMADDFHVTHFPMMWFGTVREKKWMTVAFCQRLEKEQATGPSSVVWKLLSEDAHELVATIAKKEEVQVTLDEKKRLSRALNAIIDKNELWQSDLWQIVTGTTDLKPSIEKLRNEAKASDDKLAYQQVRRLNKLLLSSYFTHELRVAQLTLLDVPVWKPVKVRVQSLNAQEAFMIWMKASFMTGLVLASPWIFLQIWNFVAAGLYPHEKNYVYLYLPISTGLFIAGASLAFGFVFDKVLGFLFWFNQYMKIDPDPRIGEWLGFVLLMPLAFGLSFQLPLIMLFLNRIGIISIEMYLEHWRSAVLIIAIAAMVLTPGGDPYSLLLMMFPLIILYFLGIGLCKWAPQGRNPFTEVYEP